MYYVNTKKCDNLTNIKEKQTAPFSVKKKEKQTAPFDILN